MTVREFRLPDPGEGLTEAEIVTWMVAAGDTVKVNDMVVEVETAKSLVELPIPFSGTISELLVAEGDMVEVGTPIIAVEVADAAAPAASPPGEAESSADDGGMPSVDVPDQPPTEPPVADGSTEVAGANGRTPVLVGYGVKQGEATRRPRHTVPKSQPEEHITPHASARTGGLVAAHATDLPVEELPAGDSAGAGPARGSSVLAKPPVRKLARDLGVDLDSVVPTGEGGVVTADDVAAAAVDPEETGTDAGAGPATGDRETRVPIKGVRKMTAQAMVRSLFTAPHVTEWVDVDVTATMDLVARLRREREFADVKVSPLLVLARAMCLAVARNPGINAEWDEDAQEIVVKHYVNLGVAAATPRGLIVPVVKDADAMTLHDLAEAIGELTATAREGRTQPAQMSGGTITVTNIGVFGVDGGTPIINPGESAILSFGAVRRMPWVVEDEGGTESIEPRWVTQLALSFDHRLVDGELGSRYLADVAALLHDPARALVWG